MINVYLVCNHGKTYAFNEIAKGIRSSPNNNTIKIYAIVYDEVARRLVKSECFDGVFDSDLCSQTIHDNECYEFSRHLDWIGILGRDRFMDYCDKNISLLRVFFFGISNFLNRPGKSLIIGEISWAYEELIFIASQRRQIEYITPSVARSWERSFFLCKSGQELDLYENITVNYISDFCKEGLARMLGSKNQAPPDYFHIGMNQIKLINRIKSISALRMKIYITSKKGFFLFASKFISILLKYFFRSFFVKNLPVGSYVFFPFHVLPEASVDYLAPEFRNQYLTAIKVAESLPPDFKLCVKFHPAYINDPYLSSIYKIFKHDKIIILNQNFDVITHSSLFKAAVVITGTLGLQLGMQGTQVYTLVRHFFNQHQCIEYLDDISKISSKLLGVEKKFNVFDANAKYFEIMSKFKFDGYCFEGTQFGNFDPLYVNSLVRFIECYSVKLEGENYIKE